MDDGSEPTAHILLYRHGEIAGGCFHVCCAGSDVDLSPEGITTSLTIIQHLLRQQVRLVVTSPLRRASFVGKISNRRHGIPHEPLSDLRERHLGVWERQSWEQIAERYKLLLQAFREQPHTTDIPEAERPPAFQERVERGWDTLVEYARRNGPIGVVGHYIWNRVALEEVLGFSGVARELHPGDLAEIDVSGRKPSIVGIHSHLDLQETA
ncbi:MAG: histidine phosphatase family protein [Candidatus Peribacteraceae bacterium]|nr:histidine phosphatase family protein [Candidatus Peribacteraceae bacterium]